MNATVLRTHYRTFELPWTPSPEEERRFRRVLGAALGLFIGFGVVVPFLPDPPKSAQVAPAVPERIVEFILEQPKPTPPPKAVEIPTLPKPVEVPRTERRVDIPAPVAEAAPKPDPRQRAAAAGLLALSDQIAELRERDVANVAAQPLSAGDGEKTRIDRAILTAKVGSGSGGIAVSEASRGFGGGATGLKGNVTTRVSAAAAEAPATEAQRSGKSSKAARTREEVELVFDRNKSAIYTLYTRALRDNPALQGKVVLELTIAPTGEVTDCRVVSSDLGDADLERKLVTRVKMFRFEDRDVAVMTTTKPIEFFPA